MANYGITGGVIFKGNNGATGGNASTINITMLPTGLFNRTNAVFNGTGGDSSEMGVSGGTGGTVQFNYHGLIGGSSSWACQINNGRTGGSGLPQTPNCDNFIQNKFLNCPRDADVDGSGVVSGVDIDIIETRYNNLSTDSGFNQHHDINCDEKLNVIEMARIGFEWDRGL